ncbi:MAG TPA: hypothetical protein VJG83_06175 [archaeon]|nr:hypothetical protein [archaeon]
MLFFSSICLADITMTYPQEITMQNGASITAGQLSGGQTFDLIFSDNSGYEFEWDTIDIAAPSIPAGWEVVAKERTDTSLVLRIKVPSGAQSNIYSLKVLFSNSQNSGIVESATIKVAVKKNLLDVSFVRKSRDEFYYVGAKVIYNVTISNSSIAPATVSVSSSLPSNWFSSRGAVLKPNSVEDIELVVSPQTSGVQPFTFRAFSQEENVIVQSFSSELNVRPTLKGKFAAPLSGFPFFTFSLLPFQLFDSFFSLVLP